MFPFALEKYAKIPEAEGKLFLVLVLVLEVYLRFVTNYMHSTNLVFVTPGTLWSWHCCGIP